MSVVVNVKDLFLPGDADVPMFDSYVVSILCMHVCVCASLLLEEYMVVTAFFTFSKIMDAYTCVTKNLLNVVCSVKGMEFVILYMQVLIGRVLGKKSKNNNTMITCLSMKFFSEAFGAWVSHAFVYFMANCAAFV